MATTQHSAQNYLMGHTERERRRLMLQGAVLNPITEDLLRRAGLCPGMTVLDIGCGAGDVSMIAARLIGRSGQVVAVDVDEEVLKTARSRASSAGLTAIEFRHGRVGDLRGLGSFDAVTGRHILIHMPHPGETLAEIFGLLRAGGVAVLQEFDMSSHSPPHPASRLFKQGLDLVARTFEAGGVHPAIGAQLYQLMSKAGFVELNARVEYGVDGGPDSLYYEWLAESVRSILPRAISLGLVTAAEMDIDTYAQRLREEAVSQQSAAASPVMFGVVGRKPVVL
jgi:ubiquinone/menaquinone biosynthesis C-methylase UbiE